MNIIGKTYLVSGMKLEILAEDGDTWQTRNITTGEMVLFDKAVLERAIRLGMAEELIHQDDVE